MKTLILGAGNLLLSDEGFGVHFIRHLQKHYILPPEVELFDAGTLGLMAGHKLEEADRAQVGGDFNVVAHRSQQPPVQLVKLLPVLPGNVNVLARGRGFRLG